MEEAEAAARAVYEAPPPRPRSAEEVADLAADMHNNMKGAATPMQLQT